MTELELRAGLLAKGIWSCKDIMNYAECGRTTASKIRQKALTLGGACKHFPQKVKCKSVLEALELDYDEEIRKINYLKGAKI